MTEKRQMRLSDLPGDMALSTLIMSASVGGVWFLVRARRSVPPYGSQLLVAYSPDGPLSTFDARIETSYPDDESGYDAAIGAIARAVARENR